MPIHHYINAKNGMNFHVAYMLCFFWHRLAHNTTSPITRTLLTTDQLIPNRSLRNAIEDEQTKQKEQASLSESSSFTTPSTAMTNGTGALAGLGVEPAQPTVSLSYREGAVPHTLELLASITPPADVDTERSGCDVCCVGKCV